MKFLYFSIIFLSVNTILSSQQALSLADCIALAKTNNLTIKNSELDVELASAQVVNAKRQFLPSLSGTLQSGLQFGLSVNPTTNQLEQTNSSFGTGSLTTNLTLFAGGRIQNTLKSRKVGEEQAVANFAQSQNNVMLQVVNQFLNVVLAKEQYELTKNNVVQSKNQLERATKRFEAGLLAAGELALLEAQVAQDEQSSITQSNQYDILLLGLKNLLLIDSDSLDIEIPTAGIDLSKPIPSFEAVYEQALLSQPSIEGAEKGVEGSLIDIKIANSQRLPSVRAFGNLDSRYSSNALDFSNPNLSGLVLNPSETEVLIDGQPSRLTTFSPTGITYPGVALGDQISDNLGQAVGISASIPIYNNSNNLLAIQQAEIGHKRATLQAEQTKQQLKVDVKQAIANLAGSQKQFVAAEKTMDARKQALEIAQKRVEKGLLDSFAFETARNNFLNAQINYTVAKYNYLFAEKVIDIYLGNQLSFEN